MLLLYTKVIKWDKGVHGMKKLDRLVYHCGYLIGRIFIYYPKALKHDWTKG